MSHTTLRPWRLLFPGLDSIPPELDEQFYSALLALQSQLDSDGIDWENIYSWNIDQNLGTITLTFEDESVALTAQIQILGSFDGSTFMWACQNSSVNEELKRDSQRLREMGRKQGWAFFKREQFPATSRDGYAIMAFAAQTLQAHSAYAGQTGDRVVYFTLYDLVVAQPPAGAARYEPEEPSIFDTFDSMINAQVDAVQLGLPELRNVEALCAKAHAEVQSGNYSSAVAILDAAWDSLGKYAVDQEPASWIRLAKGNALFLANDLPAAYKALVEAEDSFACPDKVLLYTRMGQCAAGLNDMDRARDLFVRVYVADGQPGLETLSPEHQTLVNSRLSQLRDKARQRIASQSVSPQSDSQSEQATAIVRCLIEDLHQLEEAANDLSEQAERERQVENELCEADKVAEDKINSQWCTILATWCTAGHSPQCGSRQYPPEHDPQKEAITSVSRSDNDDTIVVETTSHDPWERTWCFILCEEDDELRVSQIYSIIGDEEFPSL